MKVVYTGCVDGGDARYFAVETHRGHISLDLAKQSEHLNFKYGVSASLITAAQEFRPYHVSDDPRENLSRISSRKIFSAPSDSIPSLFFRGKDYA